MEIDQKLKSFLDEEGKLKLYPSKRKSKHLALTYLASKFENDKLYTEKEVNNLLNSWHTFQDPCLLRRELFDNYFLGRESNGSRYWLEKNPPTPEIFETSENTQE